MILKLILLVFLAASVSPLKQGDPCKRHDQSDGTCTPFKNCSEIYNLNERGHKDPKLRALIRQNVCRSDLQVTNARQVLVCCPDRENYCVNPDAVEGTCTRLTKCPRLNEIFTDETLQTPDTLDFLERSQCDTEGEFVCCTPDDLKSSAPVTLPPPTTTTAAPVDDYDSDTRRVIQKLKSPLIPRPPQCGTLLENFIFGGGVAGLTEFLWTVSLRYENLEKNTFMYNCGGSLINERYVLTAGHCIAGIKGYRLVDLRIGEYDFDTEIDCNPNEPTNCLPKPIDMEIAEQIVHPGFDSDPKGNVHNDIALLRLARKVKFTDSLKPVCLPLDPSLWTSDFSNKRFQVTGWGRTENGRHSKIKRKVRVPTVSYGTCSKAMEESNKTVIDSQICAGGEVGKDSCGGDSGGPLMLKTSVKPVHWYMAGLVSYGPSLCGTKGVPGVYTRVSSFLEWIVDNMRP